MESVGTFFKQAREAKGLSLDRMASLTRIQQPYLEALEGERFDQLPEQVFTRGFVRMYARSLGVDEHEALRRFADSAGSFYEKGEEEKRQVLKQREDDRRGKLNRNLVIVITGIILAGLIYLVPRQQFGQSSSDEAATPPVALSPVSEIPPASPVEPVSSPAESVPSTGPSAVTSSPAIESKPVVSGLEQPTPAGSAPKPSPQSPTVAAPAPQIAVPPPSVPAVPSQNQLPVSLPKQNLVLELEASEMTWIVVRSDDGEPQEALLQPGETARWRAADRFFLTLGNAGGVAVRLNGQPRGPFGKPGAVVRDVEIQP